MFNKLAGISKEDELRSQMIDMITRIESNNTESHEILQGLGNTLSQYEEIYDDLYNKSSSELQNDKIIVDARIVIKSAGEFVNGSLEILKNEESSLLDKNNLYPMLIDTIGNMILNYQIIISQINYLSK